MRGSPLTQAAVVMILFMALAYAGMRYIGDGSSGRKRPEDSQKAEGERKVDIEIFFSAKPLSYTLRRPGNGWDKGEHILTAEGSDENPALHSFSLHGEKDTTVWLDVTWPEDLADGRYFAHVVLTVKNSKSQKFTFHDHTKVLRGTILLDKPNKTTYE